MEKINEIKAMLDAMGKDLEKFYSKGQNSAGTRLRKALNDVRKKCQEMRNEIQTIRSERKSKPATE
ncbi:MAG TPA: histone H1 [Ignavibacteria bacterium]